MRVLAVLVAVTALAAAPAAQAQKAEQAPLGPVAAMVMGICLPWVAGVTPAEMVKALEARGMKASWVGDRLAGFDIPPQKAFSYSGITLGEGGAWCEVHLSYAQTRIAAIAAEIDAATPRVTAHFRLAPVTPVKDAAYGNLPDRAWAAPALSMTLTEKPSMFPGSTDRDATLYLERKK